MHSSFALWLSDQHPRTLGSENRSKSLKRLRINEKHFTALSARLITQIYYSAHMCPIIFFSVNTPCWCCANFAEFSRPQFERVSKITFYRRRFSSFPFWFWSVNSRSPLISKWQVSGKAEACVVVESKIECSSDTHRESRLLTGGRLFQSILTPNKKRLKFHNKSGKTFSTALTHRSKEISRSAALENNFVPLWDVFFAALVFNFFV